MIDVKKLALNFLAIAALVSLIAFSLSGQKFNNSGPSVALKNANIAAMPQAGFVTARENMPQVLQENLSGTQTNLTQATAENIANVIVTLNPTGPRTVDGKFGFVIPTTTILTGYLAMENPQFNVADLWVSPDNEEITLSGASGVDANQAYAQSFRAAMKETLGSADFLAKIKQYASANAPFDLINTAVGTFGDAIQKLKGISVPAPFVPFHKNLLVYLENQRSTMLVVAGGTGDPLKSLIVLNSTDAVKQRSTKDFSAFMDAYGKLDLSSLLARSDKNIWTTIASALTGTFNNAFLIRTAAAQSLGGLTPEDQCANSTGGGGIFDSITSYFGGLTGIFSMILSVPVNDQSVIDNTSKILQNDSGILALLILDCQARVLTQTAKYNLVQTMAQQEKGYVQNDGDPRFITNFANYYNDAATQGATAAYQQISTEICPQFQKDVNNIVFDPTQAIDGVTNANGQHVEDANGDTITLQSGQTTGGAGFAGLGTFGASQVNGVGTGCSIQNTDTAGYYNDFNSNADPWGTYISLLTDPSNSVYGTLASGHDDITGAAQSAANGAQAESIANQGYKADVQCTNSFTDVDGNQICTDSEILTPGGTVASQSNAALNSRYDAVVNAADLSQVDAEVADALGTELQQHPDQGLYDLALTQGNALSGVCSYLGTPSSVQGITNNLGSLGVGVHIPNPLQASCNSLVGKITAQFTKYLNIYKTITNILSKFGF